MSEKQGVNPPFALTQSALILAYALRSKTSSTERSPTSSTLTRLALRGREREESLREGDAAAAAAAAAMSMGGGSLMVDERLIVETGQLWPLFGESDNCGRKSPSATEADYISSTRIPKALSLT